MVNFFKFFMLVLCSLCCAFCWSFAGCKYKGIASIQEQIAIYQNIGFIKQENPSSPLKMQNITIEINDINQINQHLADNNINTKINTFFVLYLQQNADYIDSLLFIYDFLDAKNANVFCNYFNSLQNYQLFLYNNYVIQKGINKHILNGATNYKYYVNFYNGLRQKTAS